MTPKVTINMNGPDPKATGRALGEAMTAAMQSRLGAGLVVLPDPLVAAADMTPPNQGEQPWVAILSCEDPDTLSVSDNRVLAPECFTWMTLPLTAHLMTVYGDGHDGAEVAARADAIKRVAPELAQLLFPDEPIRPTVTTAVIARGWFDGGKIGMEAARLVAAGTLRRTSVQPRAYIAAPVCTEMEEDEFGEYCLAGYDKCTLFEIAGFTILDTPGVEAGVIRVALAADFDLFDSLPDDGFGDGGVIAEMEDDMEEKMDMPLLASMMLTSNMPAAPPRLHAGYFASPQMPRYERISIEDPDDDGWIYLYGHVAPNRAEDMEQCHIDYGDECRLAPVSPSQYQARFLTGLGIRLDDGSVLGPGRMTMGGPHAPLYRNGRVVGAAEAAIAYSDADQTVAYVNAGDDEYGWWIAGVIRPDLSMERMLQFGAHPVSGDWRVIGNAVEGIAVHSVVVPGFNPPMPQVASIDGKVVAMTAVGAMRPRCRNTLGRQVAELQAQVAALTASTTAREVFAAVVDDQVIEAARLARIGRLIGR